MVEMNGAWVRQGEAFWRAHHEAWKRSDLNQRQYCEFHRLPQKAFENWRQKFRVEPEPPERKLPPLLLPGEHVDHYLALRQAIFADLAPRSAIEWLLAIDVAELSWEIQRYRMLRHKLLETSRQQAIEAALRRIDLVGIAPDFEAQAEYYTRRNALSWRIDPIAASEIDARLAAYGFDQHAISAEVYVQAREVLVLFEGLLNAAQTKRMLLLREIRNQRFLAGPMRRPR